MVHKLGMIAFALGRLGHTYSYAYALQPHRTLCYNLALVGLVLMSLNGLHGSFACSEKESKDKMK